MMLQKWGGKVKWYIEFPILYVIVVLVLYAFGRNTWEDAAWFVSLIFGFIVSVFMYWGYKQGLKSAKKKK